MGEVDPGTISAVRSMLGLIPESFSLAQFNALLAVADQPGISVNELAEKASIPQQTASRYVSFLLGRYQDLNGGAAATAWIEQRISEDDPRKRALFLSDEGSRLVSILVRSAQEIGNKRG